LVFCSAGEISGDIHLGEVLERVRERSPDCRFTGLGGDSMRERGCELLYHLQDTAVMGFTELFGSLGRVLKARRGLKKAMRALKPDLVILTDFPDFNLPLARAAAETGIPVIYYVCPQIWAWRPRRIELLRRHTRRRALIFPFEKRYYEERGLSCDFVGNPVLDEIARGEKEPRRKKLETPPGSLPLAILPGSRLRLFQRLAPVFFAAAEMVLNEIPETLPLLALSPLISPKALDEALLPFPRLKEKMIVRVSRSREILQAGKAALLASGTAAIEAAVLGVPMVAGYKASALSWLIARALVRVPFAAPANLVAGRMIVPELLQEDCVPVKLARALFPLLGDGPERRLALFELEKVKNSLGGPGAAARVADIVLEELEKKK
jgi:lipid-A-disaccharide synthase